MFSLRVKQLHQDVFVTVFVKGKVNVNIGMAEVGIESVCNLVVSYVYAWHIVDIHAPADAAHAKHVLALQVGAVAPSQHLHHQVVAAVLKVRRDVKFSHIAGALRIAHALAVQIYERCAVYGTETQDSALLHPAAVDIETQLVGANGVDAVVLAFVVVARARLDKRRRIVVRILHVAVYRVVVAFHLPARRHSDVVPALCCLRCYFAGVGTLVGRTDEVELPFAVEALNALALTLCPGLVVMLLVGHHRCLVGIRHHVGSRLQFVDGKDCLVFPWSLGDGRLIGLC